MLSPILTKSHVRDLALSNGFKLKPQAGGPDDLHAYVYHFAEDVARDAVANYQRQHGPLTITIDKIAAELGVVADEAAILRAINTIKAGNAYLLAAVKLARSRIDLGDHAKADECLMYALATSGREVMESLEREYDELERRQMTPTMEAIIQAVHDAAGKTEDGDITLTLPAVEYDALCAEEEAREAMLSGSSE